MDQVTGYKTLFADVNKAKTSGKPEGPLGPELDELSLPMEDSELIQLKKDWEALWKEGCKDLNRKRDRNKDYWLGNRYVWMEDETERKPLADNIVFEAVESFLPVVTRQNPEPMVWADNTPEGQALSRDVQRMLEYLADILKLKLVVKQAVRDWTLSYVGCVKIGWDAIEDEIAIVPVNSDDLILDPRGTIRAGKYTGKYIGEYRCDTLANLKERYPDKTELLDKKYEGKDGTDIRYCEWWTDDYVFWTLDNEVLGKSRNPHWNYPSETTQTDDYGEEIQKSLPGYNHFKVPKAPYVFLSVFNTGKKPYDDTSLVEQILRLQDMVNKRLKQIDRNADNTNSGLALSDAFTDEEAAQAARAFRRGDSVRVPRGDVNQAIMRTTGPALPGFVYESLIDYRNRALGIFGVSGLTAQGLKETETVRGKIMVKGQDADRMSYVVDHIEQFVDGIFNWMVQMMAVYYDEPHIASVVGQEKAQEFITIANSDLNRKLVVSVKEGSLIPRDSLTVRNEAIDLFSAGVLSPIELFEKLDFADPKGSAERLLMWQTNPQGALGLAPPEAAIIPGQETPTEQVATETEQAFQALPT